MRRMTGLFGVAALGLGVGGATLASGCFHTDCDATATCAATTGTSSGSGAHDGGNPACEGDPTKNPAIVSDDCGVFVSASAAPGGDGTKTKPFQTFADAAALGKSRVFACGEPYTETKQVSFSGGVDVFGGFADCAGNWTWSMTTLAEITTAANVPGLVFDGGANHVENIRVRAPNATMGGGSSIALLVNGGSLAMTNGSLTAGDATDGDPGATLTDDPALDGDPGEAGAATCDPGIHVGPMGKTKTCSSSGNSTSGNGGDGGQIVSSMLQPASSGSDGSAMPAVGQPPDGQGGLGEGQGSPAVASCKIGQPGANGGVGDSGGGAAGYGTLSKAGYSGGPGKDGGSGKPGQGGGGGGGSKGGLSVTCASMAIAVPGASGGAGGTGGCGGTQGGGGKAGGSSIALLALDAEVTLGSVTLAAGKAGNGGPGGDGQSGGHKGTGGNPGSGKGTAQDSCRGGDGGTGGPGGPGGGGQGGHSLGIAFHGTKAPTGGTFTIDTTKNGKGGAGGTNNTAVNQGVGADGLAANCWDFGKNAACK